MARLIVDASFTVVGQGTYSAGWLSLSLSNEDGTPAGLTFPDVLHPDAPWPVLAHLVTSEGFGGADLEVTVGPVAFASPAWPGIYSFEIATKDPAFPPLFEVRPLTMGVIVTSGADRGQALARWDNRCCQDDDETPARR